MRKLWLLASCLLPFALLAQIDDFSDFSDQSDFNAFQKKSEQQYQTFLDTINSRFIKELARQWEEYETFQGNVRPQKPKPDSPVVAPKDTLPRPNVELPVGNIIQPLDTLRPSAPVADTSEAESEPKPLHIQGENPTEDIQQETRQSYKVTIDFYEQSLSLRMPVEYSNVTMSGISEKDVADLWKQLSQCDVSDYVSQCQLYRQQYNYNDWAIYELVCSFARSAFPQQYGIQTVFTVFLLNQLEIDAQVGRKASQLVVLLPSKTTVYTVPFIKRNDMTYYVFSLYYSENNAQSSIYTYSVKYSNNNEAVDLHISNPIRLPYKPSDVTYTTDYWSDENDSPIPLRVNQNMLDFYAHYPQVDMTVYASAQMTQELMDWAERQIVPFLSEVNPVIAVSLLLDYIQHSFDYATDDKQFGYEKPFFCEENFYYAQNDCEDRAILLSYFVRNFVKADIVLLDYPDHIATAIAFPDDSDISGDYYLLNGRKYYVCDPTYIGAGIGETMPQYRNVKADIITL